MGVFEWGNFPYSDFHSLNLDWILNTLKKFGVIIDDIPDMIDKAVNDAISDERLMELILDIMKDYMINVKFPPNGITPAKGDGTTDDAAAIQGCIDYAESIGGGCVFFPSGKYLTSGLNLKNNVGLNGMQGASLVLKGGSNVPLITSTANNVFLSGLTLDCNSEVQVNDINTLLFSGDNCRLKDLIIKGGARSLSYAGGGLLQMVNIYFDSAINYALTISGNVKVQANNLYFREISEVSGKAAMFISSDNGWYDGLTIDAKTPIGIECDGNNNTFYALISNAVTEYTEEYNSNNWHIANSKKVEHWENIQMNATGDVVENGDHLEENYNESTEKVSGKKLISAKDVEINSINPLTYKTPEVGDIFNTIPFKTTSNIGYKVLVNSDALENIIRTRGIANYGKSVAMIECPEGKYSNGMAIDNVGNFYLSYADINNNTATIYKVNNGTIIKQATGEFYHCNGMVIVDNLLYSADSLFYKNNATEFERVSTITVFDLELNFIKRINTDIPKNNAPGGIGYHDGKFLLFLLDGSIKEVDISTGITIDFLPTLPNLKNINFQTFYCGHYIYVVSSDPAAILIYDYKGNYINAVNLTTYIYGAGALGECESIYEYNNELYLYARWRNLSNVVKLSFNNTLPYAGVGFNGIFEVELIIDGIDNSEERIDNRHFKCLTDAYNYALSLEPGIYKFNIQTDNPGDLIIYTSTAYTFIIDCSGTHKLNSNIILHGGVLCCYGNYDYTGKNGIAFKVEGSYQIPCYLSVAGTVSATSTGLNYLVYHENGLAFIEVDINCTGDATDFKNRFKLGSLVAYNANCFLELDSGANIINLSYSKSTTNTIAQRGCGIQNFYTKAINNNSIIRYSELNISNILYGTTITIETSTDSIIFNYNSSGKMTTFLNNNNVIHIIELTLKNASFNFSIKKLENNALVDSDITITPTRIIFN